MLSCAQGRGGAASDKWSQPGEGTLARPPWGLVTGLSPGTSLPRPMESEMCKVESGPHTPFPVHRVSGSPYRAGLALGRALKDDLENAISGLIDRGLRAAGMLDEAKLRLGAQEWFGDVPRRYREEMKGVAAGSGVPTRRIVEYHYCGYAVRSCSSICRAVNGEAWAGHTNDWYRFGSYAAVVRAIDGRIPILTFGWKGDVCATVGINKQKLWMHTNGLPATDEMTGAKPWMPGFFLVREALETCSSVDEVEHFLDRVERDDAMALYVVDGKTQEFTLFECQRSAHQRIAPRNGQLLGTNHSIAGQVPEAAAGGSSHSRLRRIRELMPFSMGKRMPEAIIEVLADRQVEEDSPHYGTVFGNVACPGKGMIWFACDAFPAASKGTWRRVNWAWEDDQTPDIANLTR